VGMDIALELAFPKADVRRAHQSRSVRDFRYHTHHIAVTRGIDLVRWDVEARAEVDRAAVRACFSQGCQRRAVIRRHFTELKRSRHAIFLTSLRDFATITWPHAASTTVISMIYSQKPVISC